MERVKVSDLAKEMGLTYKDMELRIKDLNIFIDHKGTINAFDAETIRSLIKGSKNQETQPQNKPVVKRKSASGHEIKIKKIVQVSQPNIIQDSTTQPETESTNIKIETASESKIQEEKEVTNISQQTVIPTTTQDTQPSTVINKDQKENKEPPQEQSVETIIKKEVKIISLDSKIKPAEETISKEVTSKELPQEKIEPKKSFFTAKIVDRKIINIPSAPSQNIQITKPDTQPQNKIEVTQEKQEEKQEEKSTAPRVIIREFKKREFVFNKNKTAPKPHRQDILKKEELPKKETFDENLKSSTQEKSLITNKIENKVETPIEFPIHVVNFKQKKIEKKKDYNNLDEEKLKTKTQQQKKSNKKHLTKYLEEDLDDILLEEIEQEDQEEFVTKTQTQTLKKKPPKEKKEETKTVSTQPPKPGKKKITIYETIQVGELAKKMSVKASEVIMKLMSLGVMATINQTIDFDTASIVASEFGFEVEKKAALEEEIGLEEFVDNEEDLIIRPPVVTVMGHVDHGKTSLLDAIRHADVASKEAGGITQHIGAYHVKLSSGNEVVFLDTPGHEAFTQMRARGAKVTDIVLLVVAADDGVMAQTKEAIDHARAAKVPIVVAINKIDKPEANIDKVKKELAELGLIPEEWGGDTIFVNVSAKKRIGIEELIEMLSLQAEVLELKANPKRPARGHVIEARLDKGRGPVATLLVQNGTLKLGDSIVCGVHYGKIRAMINDKGEHVTEARPSMPVEVLGLSDVPEAGNEFFVVSDEKKAREISEHRQRKLRETELAKTSKITLENMLEALKEQEVKELKIILKTDVQGSAEALHDALVKLSTPEIKVNVIRSAPGAIVESDVLLASASDAIIIGFNVKPTPTARQLAEAEGVDIKFYDIIYNAIEDVKKAMIGMLEPVYEEKPVGRAEVRQTFNIPKVGTVAGCYVVDGVISRTAKVRLLRDNVVIYTGKIASLKRYKDDVREVQSGYECGICLDKFNDIKIGDIIEAYKLEEVAPTLTTETTN